MKANKVVATAVLGVLAFSSATAVGESVKPRWIDPYTQTVMKVAAMVHDQHARQLAHRHGLNILNVMWEDTGRWQGSSVGPNISDVTIEVVAGSGASRRMALMPVIRYPNFSDKTGDIKLDKFFIKVGNQKDGGRERVISLKEFLGKPLEYMSFPENGTIKGGTLLAARDTHALVSAQSAFLPVPKGGKATFHPVIFNYQSTRKNPAVLTILVTRQGTSMTIVDNARDTVGGSWGQRLFHNVGGMRAPLTAERMSDVKEKGVTSNGEAASSLGDDANLLMLVQVPLKYRQPPRRSYGYGMGSAGIAAPPAPMGAGAMKTESRRPRKSDMEVAVLGHGKLEGPYSELDGLTIERDARFPVRVTVQFYQAISDENVGPENMAKLAGQIGKVYSKADYVGSLVTPSPHEATRPTAWDGVSKPPVDASVCEFPGLVEMYERMGFKLPCRRHVGIQ